MRAAVALVIAVVLGLTVTAGSLASSGPGGARSVTAVPALARGAAAHWAIAPPARVTGTVVLAPRDSAGLSAFIARVSDRRSAAYGRYLRRGAFAARFGPAPATVSAVAAALQAGGLRIRSVSRSRLLIGFAGTAGQVHAALGTTLERYRTASGVLGRATASPVQLPASLAGAVTAVIGLDVLGAPSLHTVPHPRPSQIRAHRPARAAAIGRVPAGAPSACRAAQVAGVGADGLTDDQIANAYGAFGLYRRGDLGAGQHVALYENEPFLRSDIRTFDTCYFGARRAAAMMKRLHVFSVDGGLPTGAGTGEASLDVEDVSALAPGATIDVYQGPYTGTNPNDYDSLDEYAAIVDADRDSIVSSSWGLCEQSVQGGQPGIQQAENVLFEQAAAQGQTVFSAAGDNGSDDCNTNQTPAPAAGQDPLSVDDPSSQPYVIAVGGTATDDANPAAPIEQVWNDGPKGGSGGGGISQSWAMPSWQAAARVAGLALPGGPVYRAAAVAQRAFGYAPGFCLDALSGASACRLLPDVAAEADEFTGSITVYSRSYAGSSFSRNGWTTTGGTSSAAPLWAATLALVDGSAGCRGTAGVGFLAPQLYALASRPASYRASFHDVRSGDNDVDGIGGGRLFAAGRGFDLATGLGTPRLTGPGGSAGLAADLCGAARGHSGGSAAARTAPVVTGVSPAFGSAAGGERVTITGTGFGAGVAGVQVGGRSLAAGSFTVTGPSTIVATLPPAAVQAPPRAPAPQDGAGPANVVVTLRSGASSAVEPRARFDYVDEAGGGTVGSVATVDAIAPSGGLAGAPRPVTLLGSGFTGATAVTFGGVRASAVHVVSAYRIDVTPPPMSAVTQCAPLPSTGAFAGETNASDVCQVAVRIFTPAGASAAGRILPPFEGTVTIDALGDVKLPTGCGCEGVTAPDEYDYVPAPHITSVSTSGGPAHLASEGGGTVITIRGTGLSPLVLDWANFGNPVRAASVVTTYRFVSGTRIDVISPPRHATVSPARVPLTVTTLAGRAPAVPATYAGIPRVSGVTVVGHPLRLLGSPGAPDTGGIAIRITGRGFAGQVRGPIEFNAIHAGLSAGTNYRFSVAGRTLRTNTVAQSPGLVDARVCTASGCSPVRGADRIWLYAPGAPRVASIAPASGPAAGGTHTVIRGAGLGCPITVVFGRRIAPSVTPGNATLDCAATAVLSATSPKGRAGQTVPIHVVTVEGFFTRRLGSSHARFHYTR